MNEVVAEVDAITEAIEVVKGEGVYSFGDGYTRELQRSRMPNPGIVASSTRIVDAEAIDPRTGEPYKNEVAGTVIELLPQAGIRLVKEFRAAILACEDAAQRKDAIASFQFTVTPVDLDTRSGQALQRQFGVETRPSPDCLPQFRNPIIGLDVDAEGNTIDPNILLLDITFAKADAAENGFASGAAFFGTE